MVKSYVKIYGPPIVEALHALEKVAIEIPEVSYYTSTMAFSNIPFDPQATSLYLEGMVSRGNIVKEARKGRLISKSGVTLGDNDFFFEWNVDPTWEQVEDLLTRIDKALKPLGCKYTITTK